MPYGKQGNTGKIKNEQKENLSTENQRPETIKLKVRKEGNKGRKKILVKIVLSF